jgi:phosphoribosylformimino-5-aminoimidazole carboxamide ribotide isomerase
MALKPMEIIPAIDIRGGRCVRLYQGDFARETVFADDPAEVAIRFQDVGATRIHVVDLDGAREGHPINMDAIRRILSEVNVLVEVGGGMRRMKDIETCLDAGADAVVLGTAAVNDETFLTESLDRFPGRIIVGVDAKDGMVAVEGWQRVSQVAARDLAVSVVKMGVDRLIYTDIARDGTLNEPNFAAIEALVHSVAADVVASGGVANLGHLHRLAQVGAAGAIVGRAIYTGAVDLRQALVELAK